MLFCIAIVDYAEDIDKRIPVDDMTIIWYKRYTSTPVAIKSTNITSLSIQIESVLLMQAKHEEMIK